LTGHYNTLSYKAERNACLLASKDLERLSDTKDASDIAAECLVIAPANRHEWETAEEVFEGFRQML
jgi:hypothetical protein